MKSRLVTMCVAMGVLFLCCLPAAGSDVSKSVQDAVVGQVVDAASAEAKDMLDVAPPETSLRALLGFAVVIVLPSLAANLILWLKKQTYAQYVDGAMEALASGSDAGASVVAMWTNPSKDRAKDVARLGKDFFVVTKRELDRLRKKG